MPAPVAPVRSAIQHAGMRASNLALVLGELADAGPLSRAQLATRTGLTKSSVSGLVGDLLAGGLVAQTSAAGTPGRDRGRPAGALHIDRQGAAGLGLEVNVDHLAALVTDLGGTPRYRHVVARDNRGTGPDPVNDSVDDTVDEVVRELVRLAELARAAAEEQQLDLAGVCIAVPGTIEGGRVRSAPNLHWADVPLAERIASALPATPLGVAVDNEANLAALAELWFGGQAPPDFVHVSGEIGIGGGLVVGGRLFRGAHARAGELGHMVLDPDGPACSCGGRGCLERLAGQEAIMAEAGATDRADLLRRCHDGETRATAAAREAGGRLGVALASVASLLDPAAIVLGGLFADLAPWLQPGVEESLARHLASPPAVLASRLGAEAAGRGAAGSVVREVIADPAGYLARTAAGGAA